MSEISSDVILALLSEKSPGKIYACYKSVSKRSSSDTHEYKSYFSEESKISAVQYIEYDTIDELVLDLQSDFGDLWMVHRYENGFVIQYEQYDYEDSTTEITETTETTETIGYFFRPSDLDRILKHSVNEDPSDSVNEDPSDSVNEDPSDSVNEDPSDSVNEDSSENPSINLQEWYSILME